MSGFLKGGVGSYELPLSAETDEFCDDEPNMSVSVPDFRVGLISLKDRYQNIVGQLRKLAEDLANSLKKGVEIFDGDGLVSLYEDLLGVLPKSGGGEENNERCEALDSPEFNDAERLKKAAQHVRGDLENWLNVMKAPIDPIGDNPILSLYRTDLNPELSRLNKEIGALIEDLGNFQVQYKIYREQEFYNQQINTSLQLNNLKIQLRDLMLGVVNFFIGARGSGVDVVMLNSVLQQRIMEVQGLLLQGSDPYWLKIIRHKGSGEDLKDLLSEMRDRFSEIDLGLLNAVLAFLLKPAASYQERLGEFIGKIKDDKVLPAFSGAQGNLPEKSSKSRGPEGLVRYSDGYRVAVESWPGSELDLPYGEESSVNRASEGAATLETDVFEASALFVLLDEKMRLSRDNQGRFFDGKLHVNFGQSGYNPESVFLHYVLRSKNIPSPFTNNFNEIDPTKCYVLSFDLYEFLSKEETRSIKAKGLGEFLHKVKLTAGTLIFDEEKKSFLLFPYKNSEVDLDALNLGDQESLWFLEKLPVSEEERKYWYTQLGLSSGAQSLGKQNAAPITESGVKAVVEMSRNGGLHTQYPK